MNVDQIYVAKQSSVYCDIPHLVWMVENKNFDQLLDEIYPDKELLGLVPAISWLKDKSIKNQVYSSSILSGITPILICPDEQNLSCLVIVADISVEENQVVWKKIGIQHPADSGYIESGRDIEWLTGIEECIFEKRKYIQSIEALNEEEVFIIH